MDRDLIDAIKSRDVECVRAVLEADAEAAEQRDEDGVSALMLTHYYGLDDTAVRSARRSELDVFEAATVGDLERVRELLDEDPSLASAMSPDRTTALHFAAFFNQPEAAALLLERGADPHAVSEPFGRVTPLHSAAAAGNAETVRALLAAGADANARQQGGFTAIHAAALTGDEGMVADLLAAGADPALETDDGRTAAEFAAEGGHEALAARLRRGDEEAAAADETRAD
jgi:ankyrin repeat protein